MTDLSEHIQLITNLKNTVKSDFINYFRDLYNNTSSNAIYFDINNKIYNHELENSIKQIVNSRPHLKNSVGVFPVFIEYAIINSSKKACGKFLEAIDKQSSLTCFLESIYQDRNSLLNIPISSCQQLIIPLLIKGHFTVVVVKVLKIGLKKSFDIKYYNSYGQDLIPEYKTQLINFFMNLGKVNYQCLSKHEQKDDHNCGIYVIQKAIELANMNISIQEASVDNKAIYVHDNLDCAIKSRYQLGKSLQRVGSNIVISSSLEEEYKKTQKICF